MKNQKQPIIDFSINYANFEDFYVAVVVNEEGKEGLVACAQPSPAGVVINSMIGGTQQDKEAILKWSDEVAQITRRKVRVIRFHGREIIKEINP